MKTSPPAESVEPEDHSEPQPDLKDRPGGPLQFMRELPGLLLMALVLAILIKSFLFQAFYIPSGSMEPTLHGCTGCTGDRVLVNKIPYYFHDPRHGDIIVFSDPHPGPSEDRGLIGGALHWLFEGIGVQHPEYEDFIKRVIGVPGDTVLGKGGAVYVNGTKLEEPYLIQRTQPFEAVHVPEGMLFVMGDNRSGSDDSRGNLGFIPIDNVIGKAFVIMWPPSRAGLLH